MLSEYLTYHRINCNKSAYISIIKKKSTMVIKSSVDMVSEREGGIN